MKLRIKNEFASDAIKLYVLYLICVIAIYKLPFPIATFIQIICLYRFYRSDKGYFWLAFLFITESAPGAIFTITDAPHTFALLTNSPVGVLFFWMAFVVVGLIKTYGVRLKKPFFMNTIIAVMLIYLAINLWFFGFQKITFVKGIAPWLLLYIIPRILTKVEDYEKFFSLVFAFVFFVFVGQLVFMVTGMEIHQHLGGSSAIQFLDIGEAEEALRPTSGIFITYFSLLGSSLFLIYGNSRLPKVYLYVILGLSLLSVFLTATRGWMVGSALTMIFFVFLMSKNPFSFLPKMIIPIILILLLFNYVPFLKKQSDLAFERYETLILLIQGDETAGGTLLRIDERGPKVMKKFWESPILGWGSSPTGRKYFDPHVANQNLLMQYGIIGFLIIVTFWITYIFKLFMINKLLKSNNPFNRVPFFLIVCMLSLILIHSSSAQWFSFGFSVVKGIFIFTLLTLGDLVYHNATSFNTKPQRPDHSNW